MQNSYTFVGRLTSNGRVTIPEEIREVLQIQDGDLIEVRIVRVVKRRQEVEA